MASLLITSKGSLHVGQFLVALKKMALVSVNRFESGLPFKAIYLREYEALCTGHSAHKNCDLNLFDSTLFQVRLEVPTRGTEENWKSGNRDHYQHRRAIRPSRRLGSFPKMPSALAARLENLPNYLDYLTI